jgi:hypothetical protein
MRFITYDVDGAILHRGSREVLEWFEKETGA